MAVNRFVLNGVSYHGHGAIGEIPGIIKAKGFKKAFVASDPDLVKFGVTSKVKNDQIAGLVIGLTLTLVHILGIGFTGTSVNPARSFGPALFAGGDALKNVWVFIVAPLIGAAIAAFCWKYLSKNKK